MNKQVVLIGYSGHAYMAYDILTSMHRDVIGYYDNEKKNYNPYNLKYYGKTRTEDIFDYLRFYDYFVSIGNNKDRRELSLALNHFANPLTIAHPSAVISPSATLGNGVFMAPGAKANAFSVIEDGVICNTSAIIEHNCHVGSFSHLAPGSVLCGNVTVGKNVFIGANAVIKEGIVIGDNVTIGAGTVVIKHIASEKKVVGNPQMEI